MTLSEYMDSIDPWHAKALKELAATKGILFVMTAMVPDDVRDDFIAKIEEANPRGR